METGVISVVLVYSVRRKPSSGAVAFVMKLFLS